MKQNKRWWTLAIVSIAVMTPFIIPYLSFNPANSRVTVTSESIQFPVLVAHIASALIALLAGLLQFKECIRNERPKIHRYIGKVYVGSVGISGILALILVFYVDDFAKAVSFLALSIGWMFTTWKGYRSAVRRDFATHRIWMIRSFGLTLVAVSGRLVVPILLLTYFVLHDFKLPAGREGMIEEVLNVNIWLGIVLNLVIAEWFILRKKA